jgi:hypothetical protein
MINASRTGIRRRHLRKLGLEMAAAATQGRRMTSIDRSRHAIGKTLFAVILDSGVRGSLSTPRLV